SSNQPEYLHVNPQFRVIFTSNPEEYCGVHSTQDALMDRLVTINMPEPEHLTQTEILVQKTNIDKQSAGLIVDLVRSFRLATHAEKTSGLRAGLMIAKVCADNDILVAPEDPTFREIAMDILFNRSSLPIADCTDIFMDLLNLDEPELPVEELNGHINEEQSNHTAIPIEEIEGLVTAKVVPFEKEVYNYLLQKRSESVNGIKKFLNSEYHTALNALRSLEQKGLVSKNKRIYTI
ncbi:gas vesicle protein GvpN, partial [Cylindrospermopsis raciborskii CS-506_D]